MKPTRIFATASLIISSIALITAASISVGEEPGVVRMTTFSPQDGSPAPVPDSMGSNGVAAMEQPPVSSSPYPVPGQYAPYFERSYSATQGVPGASYQPVQPFGPIIMFESNFGKGLGYDEGYQRFNARVPYHISPNANVLIGDLSANVTFDGQPLGNAGLIYRNYDESRNRIFGYNGYLDYGRGYTSADWYRAGVGVESLGKYIDFRANGYRILGDNTNLLDSQLVGGLLLSGNNVVRRRNNLRENAYSGGDFEVGGPVPLLGRYGQNLYAGAYVLGNSYADETVGFQARWQALVTQNVTVNTYLTTDKTFGTNSWVSLQYEIPNYKGKRVLRASGVRERLSDPVVRNNRIQTHIETETSLEACINDATGLAYNIVYVDPNLTGSGTGVGTFENPYKNLSALVNNANIDVIRITANTDGSGTDLTRNGGLSLFDDQALIAANSDYELFRIGSTPFFIPGNGATGAGPLLSNPTMVAGGSVVQLANNNTIVGMQFDASNTAGTVFGNGIANALPAIDLKLQNNTFTNYVVGADLTDLSGRVIVEGNTFTGRPVTAAIRSTYGMKMSVAGGSTANLLLNNNTATNNQTAGLSVTANVGSTLNADDPNGIPVVAVPSGKFVNVTTNTGITNNTLAGNGNGIEVLGLTGSTINAAIEDNTTAARLVDGSINRSAANGILARTDGGTFNLFSLRNNTTTGQYDSNSAVAPVTNENGVVLYYTNGGTFFAASEDVNEDVNFNGILDAGEDLDADGLLDVANGSLDAGEDLNGNGILDQGIVSNIFQNNTGVGLCIVGDGSGTGEFMIGGPESALGNRARSNGDSGVAIDLTGTASAKVDSMFNTIEDGAFQRVVSKRLAASFSVTGDTFDAVYLLSNNSADGKITSFGWDIASPDGSQPGFLFDVTGVYSPQPEDDNGNGILDPGEDSNGNNQLDPGIYSPGLSPGRSFLPLNGTEFNTGLAGVNGTNVIPFPDPNNQVTAVPADRSQSLGLNFIADALGNTGFDNADTLQFQLDVDPFRFSNDPTGTDTVVTGSALAGTSASVTFLADFTERGNFTSRTVSGLLVGSATDPAAAQFIVDQTVNTAVFDQRVAGDGIRVRASDNASITSYTSVNDTVSRNQGTGMSFVASDAARIDSLTIQGANIAQNEGRGINVEARDNAVIMANSTIGGFDTRTLGRNIIGGTSFLEGNRILSNSSDGVRFLASGSGVINGNLINNTIESNLGDGAAFVIDDGGSLNFGDKANNEVISRNTIRNNNGAGISLTSNVTPATVGVLNAVVEGNVIEGNGGGGIVADVNGLHAAPPANNTLNLTVNDSTYVDRTFEQNRNFVTGNGDVGIGVNVKGNGVANVNLDNVSVTGTIDGADPDRNGDGIALTRSDASLLKATLKSVDVTGNTGDGLDVDAQGSDKNNPDQPSVGTPNAVTVTDSNFSNNGGNGAQFTSRGTATLIGDVSRSTFSDNVANGILVRTSGGASFGDATGTEDFNLNGVLDAGEDKNGNGTIDQLLPPGRRSLFDGNSITGNAVDGVQITATDNSRALVEITSNLAAATPSPHAAASTLGATSISRNGRDGIRIETTGGRSDILITSGTATTTIDGNGIGGAGGNGIRWDAGSTLDDTVTSNSTVRITKTTITNSVAGRAENTATNGNNILDPGEDVNGNGRLDPGEDVNANQDIDVAEGDGIQANFQDRTTATLAVGNVGEGNIIQNNGDDGIAITTTGQDQLFSIGLNPVQTFFGNPRPVITITDNTIGGTNNGVNAGNRGDGVSLNVIGGTAVGLAPGQVDNVISATDFFTDEFNGILGVRQSGAVPQFTMSNNLVSNNVRRGVNAQLTGASGTRDREFGAENFDPVRITLEDNTISSNGEEGILYRADAEMNQSRFVFLDNFAVNNLNYSPARAEFFALNGGSVNGNTAYASPYLNLRTVQNSFLKVTNNTVQNNGVGTLTGEGMRIDVGTGAYVAADIQGNTFGGNLEEDVATNSFLSFGNTFNSVESATVDTTFDFVYLDDTAQLDMRFQNNSGNQIAPSDTGARYFNADPLKSQFFGNVGVLLRDAALFQVDNGPALDNPNNVFINFGATQSISNAFTTGGFNLRSGHDAGWDIGQPDLGFAPFLP